MEIGRKSRVAAQSKVDLGQDQNRSIVITMLINRVNSRLKINCSKIETKVPEFGIKPNAFDMIRTFMLSNFDFWSLLP